MATKKQAVDWERIEADYRAGIKSVREIADAAGVSHTAINKRAKVNSWPRDLGGKIKAKADALVSKALVSSEVSNAAKVSEKLTVDVESEVQARIRIGHRKDIGRYRTLCMSLLAELEAQTADVPALIHLGELLRSEDDKGVDKLNDIYRAVIGLPERTKTLKALSESLKVLIALEREAFGIESTPQKVEHAGSLDVNATVGLSEPIARALDALAGAVKASSNEAALPN